MDPKPHLTLAQKPPASSLTAIATEFLADAGPRLPIACYAGEVTLAVKRAGRWTVGPRFPLGALPLLAP